MKGLMNIMALVNNPLNSGDATGSIGGVTYCYTNGGNSVRARISPNNVRSQRQGETRRTTFNRVVFEWQNEDEYRWNFWRELSYNTVFTNRLGRRFQPTDRQLFFKNSIPVWQYLGYNQISAPLTMTSKFLPNFRCVWSVSGLVLDWDLELGLNDLIVVHQWRNLNRSRFRWQRFKWSHTFTLGDTSPQLISPPSGGSGGPEGLPPITPGSIIFVKIFSISGIGVKSPEVKFRVQTS